jgi:hypothetical protein
MQSFYNIFRSKVKGILLSNLFLKTVSYRFHGFLRKRDRGREKPSIVVKEIYFGYNLFYIRLNLMSRVNGFIEY